MKFCKMNYLYAEDFLEQEREEEREEQTEQVDSLFPESYVRAKSLIFAKLIATKEHLDLLARIPNESILDLSLIVYMFKNQDPDEEEIPVTREMMETWKVSQTELICDALSNTRSLMGERVCPLREMVKEMAEKLNLELEEDPGDALPMFVFTNLWKHNGAICMLYSDTMQEIADMMENDLYVVPSSVHEVILVPVGHGIHRGQLDSMIREINRTELLPEDILSSHSYVFSRKLGKVIL